MLTKVASWVLALTALVAASCGETEALPDASRSCSEYIDVPVEVQRQVDLLLVVDNSPSMLEEQAGLVQNLQRFAAVLEAIEGGLPDIHIGFVSSDMGVSRSDVPGCTIEGDDGRMQALPQIPGCLPPTDAFIANEILYDRTRKTNYTGTLAEAMACIAPLGADGCRYSQPLGAVRRALNGTHSEHFGFLREQAMLVVVLITDQDDCSARLPAVFDPAQVDISDPLGPLTTFRCTEFGVMCDGQLIARTAANYTTCEPRGDSFLEDPMQTVEFLKNLKPFSNVVVSTVTGPRTPFVVDLDGQGLPVLSSACTSPAGTAQPAPRLASVIGAFPNRSSASSICNADLSDALIVVAEQLAFVRGSWCLPPSIDPTDIFPDAPGLQLDCQVSDVVSPNQSGQEETPLPRCRMDDGGSPDSSTSTFPCWWTERTSVECPDTGGLILRVAREQTPPAGTHVIARCVTRC